MIYELRTYTAAPGKLARLHERFRAVTLRQFEKHGMHVVGFWETVASEGEQPQLVYVLAFPSQAAGEAAWTAFRADEEWVRAKAASEHDGLLAEKVESQWLRPTDYSPLR